jgi:hypothetical protein
MTSDPILPSTTDVNDTAPNVDRPVLVLVGEDGNAFNILGRARQALRLAGRGDDWAAFVAEATSGNYDHLLATAMRWFEVE